VLQAQIEKRLFTIGENIDILCKLSNTSKKNIDRIDISIVQYVKYSGDYNGHRSQAKSEHHTVTAISDVFYQCI
jgi:hypothetical protein